MRLIDADELIEKAWDVPFETGNAHFVQVVDVGDIMNAPTIDPDRPRPRGQWVGEADGYADGELVYDVWYCSECNHCVDDGTDNPEQLPNFCSNCGADMR